MTMTSKEKDFFFNYNIYYGLNFINNAKFLTATTESLAATAKMSAQDTTPGHKFSNWDLMVSITSKPLIDFLLGRASLSPSLTSNSTDASHPCYKMLHKLFIFYLK